MGEANKACVNRLQREYRALLKEPVPHITAHPSSNSILQWHFVLEGSPGTEFEGGVYHGKVTFPPQYPFKPPSISLYTPNGRFAVNTRLCLSMTDFHPESWNPMWSVGTILTGLLSFMYDSQPTTGSIATSAEQKRRYAAESLAYNVKSPVFAKLFPEFVQRHEAAQAAAATAAAAAANAPPAAAAAAKSPGDKAAADGGSDRRQGSEPADGDAAAAAAPLAGVDAAVNAPPLPLLSGWSFVALTIAAVLVAVVALPLLHPWGSPAALQGSPPP